MRIFRNPSDRKRLEENEQRISAAPVTNETKTQHGRMESKSAGSKNTAEAEQATEETKTTTKKAWKEKADTTV